MDTVKGLKGRQWSLLIVLILLNWLVFSSLARFIVQSTQPGPTPTRTAKPTFTVTPTPRPPTATPTETGTPTPTATRVLGPHPPPPTDTPVPGQPQPPPAATATQPPAPRTGRVTHTVQRGETLSSIAEQYGVNVWYIAWLNDISDPSLIFVGQQLTIPAPGEVIPSPTPPPAAPTATSPPPAPAPTDTPAPPPAAPTDTPAPQPTSPPASNWQFIPNGGYAGAPNLGLTRVYGTITDSAGNPVNGYRLKLNCYGNVFISYPSGPSPDPCEGLPTTGWAPGFYDFTVATQARTMDCYISVIDRPGCEGEGTPLSEEFLLHFEAPNETILIWNWLKQW